MFYYDQRGTQMHDVTRNQPIIIAISGASGSGKTTVARKMSELFQSFGHGVAMLSQDYYYKDQREIDPASRPETNYDQPDAFEHALLIEHLQCLKRRETVHAPIYDYTQHTRNPSETQTIQPADIIIIEGILLFHDLAVVEQFDYKIFIDTPEPECLERRMRRDVEERGRDKASIEKMWLERVKPSIDHYIRPSAGKAQISINNSLGNRSMVDRMIAILVQGLHKTITHGKKKRKAATIEDTIEKESRHTWPPATLFPPAVAKKAAIRKHKIKGRPGLPSR
jgi:uridine kinase